MARSRCSQGSALRRRRHSSPAVAAWEHQIEEHEVERLFTDEEKCVFASRGEADVISIGLELATASASRTRTRGIYRVPPPAAPDSFVMESSGAALPAAAILGQKGRDDLRL